jgi:uncharacterized RDD family membrane protein YckC
MLNKEDPIIIVYTVQQYSLATRTSRLIAAIMDTTIQWGPPVGILGILEEMNINKQSSIYDIFSVLMVLFFLVIGIMQIYFLVVRGQTIGKIIKKIKIVKKSDDSNGGFKTNVLFRAILNNILCNIPFYWFIDVLMIFNKDNECIHDTIAGTKVVNLLEKEKSHPISN